MSYDYSSYYGAAAPPAPTADHTQYGQYGAPPPHASYGAPPPAPGYGAPPPHYGAPAPYGAPPGPYGAPMGDEVRTIFITGFPQDVKERELQNLLRFLPGYEASQMNYKNGQAQGFALFSNPAFARAACDAITQLVYEEGVILRCEMARKNMYIKDMDQSAQKRARTGPGAYTGAASSYAAAPGAAAAPAPYRPPYSGGGGGGAGGGGAAGDNPPCNTLFVGNLSETINEAELNGIFANQPGFRQLKIVRGRNTTAFVEYDTTDNAQRVHDMQQGAVLASNDRGAIRIQYSRNPFGKKRDVTGILIDTPVRNPDYVAPGSAALGSASGGIAGPVQQQASVGGGSGYEPVPYDPTAAAGAPDGIGVQ